MRSMAAAWASSRERRPERSSSWYSCRMLAAERASSRIISCLRANSAPSKAGMR